MVNIIYLFVQQFKNILKYLMNDVPAYVNMHTIGGYLHIILNMYYNLT